MQFVRPMLFQEAVDKLGSKTIIGSTLNSSEWADVPVGLRDRAFFSATIENVRFLQRASDVLGDFLDNSRDETGALLAGSRADFVKQLSDFAQAEGMGPLDPDDEGTIKDITSQSRLSLIFNTQTQAAYDFGYWKQGMDPDVLNEFPAQRFVRVQDVVKPRPVHQANEGRVELKTNLPFWLAMNDPRIGGFNVPWGPWGFNSGMGVEDADRGEAEQLGLVQPGEQLKPIAKDVNEHLQASTAGLDPAMIDYLKNAFGDQVEFDGDTVKWSGRSGAPEASTEPSETEADQAEAAPQGSMDTLDQVLERVGISDKAKVTADDMRALVDELREESPAKQEDVIESIKGVGAKHKAILRSMVQEFLDFIPATMVGTLSDLNISVESMKGATLGSYGGKGMVRLNEALLSNPEELRRTLFHELMHWRHLEGDKKFQEAITAHFESRTSGERMVSLPGYGDAVGKTDKWYDAYAGRIYSRSGPGGIEVPTRYIEWLTMPPAKMARLWNDPDFQETMRIVLGGLF